MFDLRAPVLATAVLFSLAGQTNLFASERLMGRVLREKIEWQGFSILQPPEFWYLYRREQAPTKALLHRDFVNPEHTMSLSVRFEKLPENAENLNTAVPRFSDATRFHVIGFNQSRTWRQGEPAVLYNAEVQDLRRSKKLAEVIVTRERGIVFRHPSSPNAAIRIVFSETAPQDQLHDAAYSQADAMINRVAAEVPQPGRRFWCTKKWLTEQPEH